MLKIAGREIALWKCKAPIPLCTLLEPCTCILVLLFTLYRLNKLYL